MALKNQADENFFTVRSHKQKKPRSRRAGFLDRKLILFAAALRCLQRIDLCLCGRNGSDMGRQVAVSVFPFQRRFRTCGAIPSAFDFSPPVASLAGFHDRMAESAIIGTSFCGHQSAFLTFAYSFTNQSHHPLVEFQKGP